MLWKDVQHASQTSTSSYTSQSPVCVWQAVQARCRQVAQDAVIEVQTLDLTSPYAELQAAAALADGAFGGAGIDYLVHNAGAPAWP